MRVRLETHAKIVLAAVILVFLTRAFPLRQFDLNAK